MDYGDYRFFKAFDRLCKNVAEIKAMLARQAVDATAVDEATRRLKESGDALDEKVRTNPAPAP